MRSHWNEPSAPPLHMPPSVPACAASFFVRRLVPQTGKGSGWDQVGAGRPGGAATGVETAVATVECCAAGCAVIMDAAVAAG